MNTGEELFDEYLQQECGKHSSGIDSEVTNLEMFKVTKNNGNRLIESIRRSFDINLPIPYIGFIDENVINACAFIHEEKDFIGINAGTVLILYDVYCRILAHPELCLEIGDASLEVVPQQYYDSITDFRYIDQNDTVIPKDSVRAKHAFQLAMTALDFLVTHEYAHLIFGHVHLNDEYRGKASLFELESVDSVSKNSIGGLTRQTLEMDADVFGTNIGFRNALARVQLFKASKVAASTSNISEEVALYNWMFAVYIMFRLFDSKYNIANLETSDYPPPTVRAFYIASTITSNYQLKDKPKYFITDTLVKAMMDADNALDNVFYNHLDKYSLTYDYLQAAKSHSSKLTHNWKNVRPLLEPFSRGQLVSINE